MILVTCPHCGETDNLRRQDKVEDLQGFYCQGCGQDFTTALQDLPIPPRPRRAR